VSAPGYLILLPLEGRPRVVLDALHDDEEHRLHEWLEASGYIDLVERALDLADEERAA
jgi:hypothetical protein